MTDNEIIKTLGCCIKDNEDCWDCPLQNKWDCHNALKNNALELINRQKAEIERLQTKHSEMCIGLKVIKRNAIKEFAERLKEKSQRYPYYEYGLITAVPIEDIDNLVKEMTSK